MTRNSFCAAARLCIRQCALSRVFRSAEPLLKLPDHWAAVSRLGYFHHRHLWRKFQAPKILDRHFVAVDWPRIYLPSAKCRTHFWATAMSNFGSGLKLPLLGLNAGLRRPSEAPEAPEAPQRPLLGLNAGLRRASEAPEAPEAPQRPLLGHKLGLRGPSEAPEAPQRPLRGPSWVTIWASEAWVSFWAWEGGGLRRPIFFSAATMWRPLPAQKFSSAKSDGRQGCLTPSITPFPPRKRSLFSPFNKKIAKLVVFLPPLAETLLGSD